MLAHLLSTKPESCAQPFEMKVGAVRFVGWPQLLAHPGPSAFLLHVVFVLRASAAPYLVNAFQKLSRRLAIAIDAEQTRCQYFTGQSADMIAAHDLVDGQGQCLLLAPSTIVSR
jgi:hypothetical protein